MKRLFLVLLICLFAGSVMAQSFFIAPGFKKKDSSLYSRPIDTFYVVDETGADSTVFIYFDGTLWRLTAPFVETFVLKTRSADTALSLLGGTVDKILFYENDGTTLLMTLDTDSLIGESGTVIKGFTWGGASVPEADSTEKIDTTYVGFTTYVANHGGGSTDSIYSKRSDSNNTDAWLQTGDTLFVDTTGGTASDSVAFADTSNVTKDLEAVADIDLNGYDIGEVGTIAADWLFEAGDSLMVSCIGGDAGDKLILQYAGNGVLEIWHTSTPKWIFDADTLTGAAGTVIKGATWNGVSLGNAYVDDNITIDEASDVDTSGTKIAAALALRQLLMFDKDSDTFWVWVPLAGDTALRAYRDAVNDTTTLEAVGVLKIKGTGSAPTSLGKVLIDSAGIDTLVAGSITGDSLWIGVSPPDAAVANFTTTKSGYFMQEADIHVGSATAGMIEIGDAMIALGTRDTTYNTGLLDLGGTMLFRQVTAPDRWFEFAFYENGGDLRFVIPQSGVGLGTWNARSMFIAGPAVLNDSVVYFGYWGFSKIDANTTATGADLGVQDDLEVMGKGYFDTLDNITAAPIQILADVNMGTNDLIADIIMDTIGAPTFSTVQQMQNIFHSTGWTSGGAFTDSTDGAGDVDSLHIAAGTGLIRASDLATDTNIISFFDWGDTIIAIPADTTLFIGVKYNSGAPVVFDTTADKTLLDHQRRFELGTVTNEGGLLHLTFNPHVVGDHATTMIERVQGTMGIQRDNDIGGLILGETGTRNPTVTAGTLFSKLNQFAISAIDLSSSGSMDRYYRAAGSGFTKEADTTQWDNTQYDDGDGGLATIANNKYAVQWFYIELDGALISMYGRAEHNSLSLAEGESPPSTLPLRLTVNQAKLIGRIIFQESAATASEIQTVFTTSFPATAAEDHGNLAGLSDDDHTQYLLRSDFSDSLTVDSTNIAADALSMTDMNWTYEWIYLTNVYGFPRALSDSIYLYDFVQLGGGDTTVTVYDSAGNITAGDDDTVNVSGWFGFACTADSLEVMYRISSGSEIVDGYLKGPDLSTPSNLCDSIYETFATDLVATAWDTAQYAITDISLTAGDRLSYKYIVNFDADNDLLEIGWIRVRVKR